MDDLARLARRQAGVVSRTQVLGLAGDDVLIERMLRRREWTRVHDGVYVDHTGSLSRRQREWAALLRYPGSVLSAGSALGAAGLEGHGNGVRVELAVPHGRRIGRSAGIDVRQLRCFEEAALTGASPPRLRIEHAALLVASRAAREDAAVAVLADVVREGATTTARLALALARHPRLTGRALLRDVLVDVGAGAESPLERRYLRDVERAHGLPVGERQVREAVRAGEGESLRIVIRDVRYAGLGTLVELDGRLGHGAALDRWADLTRDLEAATRGDLTLRAGWQQVLEPCRLALLVSRVLRLRGWAGSPRPCAANNCLLRVERAA